ncbi:MAG: glycosyltransferase family 4 protein, partial [Clostridia bacterium]|nr:glycosyltransferase family 4 protein [Clostridia bacterium]
CGTPIVGFEAGGPESISLPEYSSFVPYGDVDALEKVAQHLMAQGFAPETVAAAASSVYSAAEMTRRYIELYRSMLCV